MTAPARLTAALEGRFVIERELGAGGMATVYLAKDLKHEREVALKVLRPELGAVLGADRFLSEIKITARLDHPHILTLIDSGAEGGFLYYVLPYVRGESLRTRIDREKQLPIEEALGITRQIASALDYAHKAGVVHRDIKPENILIREGEAVLADFGIALAVKEAGGNRLTETGLSLGTPQYMSPEQATGDRTLDARSDVYSLAAVLYEMLAGEPPVTGPTAQAMIAKLMTERPTQLRVVRDTVPENVNAAVAKALAKIPADRFATAGEFARAISESLAAPARTKPRRLLMALGGLGVAALAAGIFLAGKLTSGSSAPLVVLRDRTQLTFTARVRTPAISPDGVQLAYVTQDCRAGSCNYAIEIQDVGGTEIRRVFTGATSLYGLTWSADRRHILFQGTVRGRYGVYLLSTLGGAPRFVTSSGAADFFAGGDSLIVTPFITLDTAMYVAVTGLDGVPRDSIRVAGPAAFGYVQAAAGTAWFLASVFHGASVEIRVIDRAGRVSDVMTVDAPNLLAHPSRDALWMRAVRPGGGTTPIVRILFDAARGRFGDQRDTVYTGMATGFSVTEEGDAIVLEEGTSQYDVFALDARDAFRGVLPEARRVIRSSTFVRANVSPDGRRLLVARELGGAIRLSLMLFEGGAETPLPLQGRATGWFWLDSATIALRELVNDRYQLSVMDVTGRRSNVLAVTDSAVGDFIPLPDGGWVWTPSEGRRLFVQDAAGKRSFDVPDWYISLIDLSVMPDGRHLAYLGWNVTTFDSLRVSVLSLADSSVTTWATFFAENGFMRPLPDGSLLLSLAEGQELVTFYRLRGPGRVERVGRIPRPVETAYLSNDLRRAVVTTREAFGDAFLSRVVRP